MPALAGGDGGGGGSAAMAGRRCAAAAAALRSHARQRDDSFALSNRATVNFINNFFFVETEWL